MQRSGFVCFMQHLIEHGWRFIWEHFVLDGVLLVKDYIRDRDNFGSRQEAENYNSHGDSLSGNCQVIRQGLRYRLVTFKKKLTYTSNIDASTRLK